MRSVGSCRRATRAAQEVGDNIGGRVIVIVSQHCPYGGEAVTARDHARFMTGDTHLAESDRGREPVAQAEAANCGGNIATLGDIIVNGLP
jgi:hypothetical protein